MLWQAIETLSGSQRTDAPSTACVPADAQTTEQFDAAGLSRLVK